MININIQTEALDNGYLVSIVDYDTSVGNDTTESYDYAVSTYKPPKIVKRYVLDEAGVLAVIKNYFDNNYGQTG